MPSGGSVVKRAFSLLSARPITYALVTLLPYIVALSLPILIGRLIHLAPHAPVHEQWDPVTLWREMTWSERLLIFLGFIALTTGPTYVAARGACRVALEQTKARSASLGSTLADMLRFIPIALLYCVLIGIPTFLAGSFFVIPGLMVSAYCAMAIPAGVDQRLGPFVALRRGFSLVGRVFGRVLAVYACYIGFVVVGRVIVGFFFSSTQGIDSPPVWISLGLWFLLNLLALAPVNIMVALLYCEARDASGTSVTAASV